MERDRNGSYQWLIVSIVSIDSISMELVCNSGLNLKPVSRREQCFHFSPRIHTFNLFLQGQWTPAKAFYHRCIGNSYCDRSCNITSRSTSRSTMTRRAELPRVFSIHSPFLVRHFSSSRRSHLQYSPYNCCRVQVRQSIYTQTLPLQVA